MNNTNTKVKKSTNTNTTTNNKKVNIKDILLVDGVENVEKKEEEVKKQKHPGGRPKRIIDQKVFEGLCAIQCTLAEICDVLHTNEHKIDRYCKETYNLSFGNAYKKLSAGGKASLRRIQFNLAKTSAAMAIWLGKQYLNQKDYIEETHIFNSTEDDPLTKAIKKQAEISKPKVYTNRIAKTIDQKGDSLKTPKTKSEKKQKKSDDEIIEIESDEVEVI